MNINPLLTTLLLANSSYNTTCPVPVIVYLSGRQRGTTRKLHNDVLRIGTAADAEIPLSGDSQPAIAGLYATLHRAESSYELATTPEHPVWVNGERVNDHQLLHSGDILEMGQGGHVLRFRLYPAGSTVSKSMAEAFADCVNCASSHSGGLIRHSAWFIYYLLRELGSQTSLRFRLLMLVLIVMLTFGLVMISHHSLTLESNLANETNRLSDMLALLETVQNDKSQFKTDLQHTAKRLETLENRSLASQQVIAAASRAVVFLQGGYTLVEKNNGRPLRYVLGPNQQPLRLPNGAPAISLDGDGEALELNFTGTGFVASTEGLLLSNRHVAQPWEFDQAAQMLMARYPLEPVMQRFVGYLPGRTKPFAVTLVQASDVADLAVLQSSEALTQITPLPLSQTLPVPGEAVIIVGYPTGLVALLARLNETQVENFKNNSELDFWAIAAKLAEHKQINPLANAGIIGQTAESKIIYDAATTSGGSGGPVLDMNGNVVAINMAVLGAFDGSNMGVPASFARQLLNKVKHNSISNLISNP